MKPLLGLAFVVGLACVGQDLPFRFVVRLDGEAAAGMPASVEMPAESAGKAVSLWRRQGAGWEAVPCQPDPAEARRLWWIAGAGGEHEIRAGATPQAPVVVATKGDETLDISRAGKPVLSYRHALQPPPAGASPRFARAGGFIHPLHSPSGEILTAIHPKDHIHHFGLWNPWTSTEFAGRHVDFWNLNAGQGTVRFVRFESTTSGPVFGGFRAVHEHVALHVPGGPVVVLEEIWDVRVWNVAGPWFLVDFATAQRCVADQPLTLNAYRYGGLGFRGRAGWNDDNSGYLTSEGRTRADGNATRARWCHAYGETPGGGAGALFLSHPENRAHPEPLRLWPKGMNKGRDNVFLNFCPVQKAPWILEPGRSHVLRYRICLYDGAPAEVPSEALWRAFARPAACVPDGSAP